MILVGDSTLPPIELPGSEDGQQSALADPPLGRLSAGPQARRSSRLGIRISPRSLPHTFVTAGLRAGHSLRKLRIATDHAGPKIRTGNDAARKAVFRDDATMGIGQPICRR
jgi:hypothetical protein